MKGCSGLLLYFMKIEQLKDGLIFSPKANVKKLKRKLERIQKSSLKTYFSALAK
jgi:hypothetical protein